MKLERTQRGKDQKRENPNEISYMFSRCIFRGSSENLLPNFYLL